MTRFCTNCGRIVRYDSYFGAYICVACGCKLSDTRNHTNHSRKSVFLSLFGAREAKKESPAASPE